MKRALIILCISIFFSCTRNNTDINGSDQWFKIEIKASRNLDCGLPEINFLDHQNEAYGIIGDNRGTYIAYGLPKVNYQPGDELWVKIRKPAANELGVCTMLGPTWNWVTITETK
jgi:hypothetical protein